jgi:uncharacterized protein (TIGR03032 family)
MPLDQPIAAAIVTAGDSAPPYSVLASPGLTGWLHASGCALAVTTYQIGKLFLIGAPAPDRLSVAERTFERCLGVAVGDGGLVLASRHAITRFQNVVPAGGVLEGHDGVFVPQVSWFTGDVFAHDVGMLRSGLPIFVNTMFSCLAVPDERSSFRSVWQPPFISALRPEDRCHLNGLAMDGGAPRFVTATAPTNEAAAWRDKRTGHGCVIDVASNEVVAAGLTMPHSPRVHEGRLFLCNAGTGEVGEVELGSGRFTAIAACPGFARGLAVVGDHAVVGLSLPRENKTFSGLPLDDRLTAAGEAAVCAIQVVNLITGATDHWLRLGGIVRELYDVVALPGLRAPMAVGFAQQQINRLVTRGPSLDLRDLV